METRGYSTNEGVIEKEAIPALGEEAPEHLNEKEKVIWELLMRELECEQLEVCFFVFLLVPDTPAWATYFGEIGLGVKC